MKLLYTQSAEALAKQLPLELGAQTIKQFSDGELFVKIEDNLDEVWLIADTQAPANNLLECFLMLDALIRAGTKVNLIITYFGFGRQDKAKPGEALSAQMLSKFFDTFSINRFFIVHPHDQHLQKFLSFTPLYPIDIYTRLIDKLGITTLVAPDDGARDLCERIADINGCDLVCISKTRPDHESVELSLIDAVPPNSTVLLLDDIITTGNTLIHASQLLHDAGVKKQYAIATHGLFTQDAVQHIDESNIAKLFVTDSIPQTHTSDKIETISIAPLLTEIITQNV